MIPKRPYSWKDSRISVGNTPYGLGAFATERIDKGSLLMIFGGYILTHNEEKALPASIRDAAIQIERGFVLGVIGQDRVSETDFVNHSCSPSAGIKGQISLVSRREINPGEEITFDYGTVLYTAPGEQPYELECRCGSKSCRGKVSSEDWKSGEFQKLHAGFLPYYIVEEIEASRA